ncbi:M20/M25/M40 family metallo-hydrolase [Futiania mangrovi]|uniref:M20/M25/M40 family metallo-hydrolase n=1 Tax=Futiania mangrovi TaxID=2959716 RepID=A0A9J6PC63_9PROT|nr:M20/M25/M40 family metallo-hydrolase [Futiania mangrovii]MCP1337796.1 M20/M25/M40 family metallo-hydrolase [Futiania mangrovii]
MTGDTLARALDAVDSAFPQETAFLAELVRVPSDNPPGDCAPHAERTAALLEQLGFTVARDPVPEADAEAHGMVSATNLIVRHRFGDGPVLALNAHGDVVPPGEGWTTDPYGAEIRDGWMYGRGVAVSKSDFATYAFALRALVASGVQLSGTVELHLTYDEEAGGEIGPRRLLDTGLSKPDFAICAGFSYAVTVAHNGCLHLEVTVTGTSAHAARPDTGHDALEAASTLLAALYAYRKGLADIHSAVPGIDSPSMVIGLISGGINTNVVPDKVTLRIDRRIVPEEDCEAVEAELKAVVARALDGLPGIGWRTQRVLLARPFGPVHGSDALAATVAEAAQVELGVDVPLEGVPLYADARHYAAAGIPTVMYGAGPSTLLEANGHRADERVALEDLRKATRVIVRVLFRLLERA